MQIYEGPRLSPEEACPYLDNRQARHEFMLAHRLSKPEWDHFLEQGWRKFGLYFFRPQCIGCQECRPIRVELSKFTPSKSQRRVIRKNEDIRLEVKEKELNDEIFHLYQKHTRMRFKDQFNPQEKEEDFWLNHYPASTHARQFEYYLGEKLVAVGFLDLGEKGLSSSYFFFDPTYEKRSLGIYGALKEIEWGKQNAYTYYYLGYWIKENKSMNYKANFKPFELYDWNTQNWSGPTEPL